MRTLFVQGHLSLLSGLRRPPEVIEARKPGGPGPSRPRCWEHLPVGGSSHN
jgi:hypothetical protein